MGPKRGQEKKVRETRKKYTIPKRIADLNNRISIEKLNLQQLKDGTHPEYLQRLKKMEEEYQHRLALNQQWREHQIQLTENMYKEDVKDMFLEVVDKMEDMAENKGIKTKKQEASRKVGSTSRGKEAKEKCVIKYILDEKEINEDIKTISTNNIPLFQEAKLGGPMQDSLEYPPQKQHIARIESRRLLYDKQWFLRGQAVFVEGKDLAVFPATISSIGADTIYFKNITSAIHTLVCITKLHNGDITIRRRIP